MLNGNRTRSTIGLASEKIQSGHRDRLAIVYVRQSTMQQIERNQESTRLQYALAERAFHLGWPREGILVIDDDLGRSGASIEGRLGFQRLVAEVALGHVGMVLGIEMSRLARSCADWYHLLESCARFDTLIADADGVYDPGTYNDRLLLGLKGTMSEAELHIIKGRMEEGRRAKARRGELFMSVPMGYVIRPSGEVLLDPDEQVQATIRLVFDLFERFRTLGKVWDYLETHDIKLPVRLRCGPNKGDLEWHHPTRAAMRALIRHPIYAGAYTYGRSHADPRRQKPGQRSSGRVRGGPAEEAEVLIHDRVPAYITWAQYQRNLAQLEANAVTGGGPGAVRAGQALLSGIVYCPRCGRRMAAHYNHNGYCVHYTCAPKQRLYREPTCQTVHGPILDALVTDLVLKAMAPAALDVSLRAAADIEAERRALDRHWRQRLERTHIAVERARRQYDAVEPENRLVARTLERTWEEALAEHTRLEAEHERFQRDQPARLSEAEMAAITALTEDLPALWRAPTTTQAERQTIVRLLLDRVVVEVIDKSEQVRVECHWAGGHRTHHHVVRPLRTLSALSTYDALVARVTALHYDGLDASKIAAALNAEGWQSARSSRRFGPTVILKLLVRLGLMEKTTRPLPQRIERRPNEWTPDELATHVGMRKSTLYNWVRKGRLRVRLIGSSPRGRKLIYADAADIETLKTAKPMPPPWCGIPVPDGAMPTSSRNPRNSESRHDA